MSKSGIARLVTVAAIVAAALSYWVRREPAAAPGTEIEATAASEHDTRRQALERSDTSDLPHLQLPRSLAGTEVAGDVVVDADGRLRVTRSLRLMFDYFLSAQGEVQSSRIPMLLRRHLEQRQLAPAVITEVMELFRRYRTYLDALGQLPSVQATADNIEAIREAMQARALLRRSMLGIVVADAFFSEEQAHDKYAIEQLAILKNPALSPQRRQEQLDALQQTLSPEQAAEENRMEQLRQLSVDVRALKADGADPQMIRALRLEVLGPEATARFEELDREEQAWNERVAAFRDARAEILARPGLTPVQQRDNIDELVRSRFSASEALRLSALDEIERTQRK